MVVIVECSWEIKEISFGECIKFSNSAKGTQNNNGQAYGLH